jgi:deoxycytidylate deaminase
MGISSKFRKDELVIGLVSPIGVDLATFEEFLENSLSEYGYRVNQIKLSNFLKEKQVRAKTGISIDYSNLSKRYDSLMTAGNKVRELSGKDDFLAAYAASQIAEFREQNPETEDSFTPTIHILHSLKHKDEVKTLREIYGQGFWLMGIYCNESQRLKYLERKGCSRPDAMKLVLRDQEEANKSGQQTRKVFELSDVFIDLDVDNSKKTQEKINRFFELLFGHPFRTPTKDENAMFLAYSSSLRSGSLARQVGAIILSDSGEIIATGTNDAPRAGGGLYWVDDPEDNRDYLRGYDSNTFERDKIVTEITKLFHKEQSVLNKSSEEPKEEDFLQIGEKILKGSQLYSLTEFGHDVHAEMEALLCCARISVSPKGGTLYTTTFPCHNCAKHIVASGISRVVYIEPYPKSKAKEILSDSITVEDCNDPRKVSFEHFVGIGPRRYFDLFSLSLSSGYPIERKDSNGKRLDWKKQTAKPRIPMPPVSYEDLENIAIGTIWSSVFNPVEDATGDSE